VCQHAFPLSDALVILGEAEGQIAGREYAVVSLKVLHLKAHSGGSAYDCEFVISPRPWGLLVTTVSPVLRPFPALAVDPRVFVRAWRRVMLARITGTRNMFGAAGHLLAMAYALAGRAAEAVSLYEQASDALSQLAVARSWILAGLAEVWLLGGRAAEATTLAHTAFDLSQTQREGVWAVRAMQVLGHVYAHGESPDIEVAEGWYRRALIRADELSARPFAGHSHLGLGTLYAKTGRRGQAVEHLTEAAALYREMEMTFWLERADARLRSLG